MHLIAIFDAFYMQLICYNLIDFIAICDYVDGVKAYKLVFTLIFDYYFF